MLLKGIAKPPWENKTYHLRRLYRSSRLLKNSDMNYSWCKRQGTEDATGESVKFLREKHKWTVKDKQEYLLLDGLSI